MTTSNRSSTGVTIKRMVEWPDTDAAGHYHHSTVIRWVEAAEAVLHDELGLPDLFGIVPRVHYEVDYLTRLWFRDQVEITLEVAQVGETSATYAFQVTREGGVVARGSLVCVHTAPGTGGKPWPPHVRRALEGAPGDTDVRRTACGSR